MLSVAPGKGTMLHWKVTHLRLFGQHKQDLIGVKKKKKKTQSCVKGTWEKFREKMERSKVLKEPIKLYTK